MTEQKTPAGEPVEEPTVVVDDVVGNANEGLADAEAAGRSATGEQELAQSRVVEEEVVVVESTTPDGNPVVEEVVVTETAASEPAAAPTVVTPAADDDVPWYDRPDSVPMDPEPATVAAPVAPAAVTTAFASQQQPIFVQAPEAPRPRGNRAGAGAIGLLAALAFAVLSFGVLFGFAYLTGAFDADSAGEFAFALATSWLFWIPVVAFYLAFWLLGAVLNRARWAHWVIWGLLVGVASYAGYLLGALFQAPFWELTARQGAELVQGLLFSPSAILAFVLGRELTVWFGAWVAARGRRITALNDEAQREYERTLEAGPQLHQV